MTTNCAVTHVSCYAASVHSQEDTADQEERTMRSQNVDHS